MELKRELNFRRMKSLVNISTSLNTSLNIHQLLPIIMMQAKDLLEAEASSLFLFDESDSHLYCEVALGEKGEVLQKYIRLELGDGIVGWVAKEGKPVLIENAYEDPRFDSSWDKKTGFVTTSLICVPLFQKNRLIGTLEVLNKTKDRIFDSFDLELLGYLADMAAIAIENAALNENLRKRIMELSLIYDFDRQISANTNIQELGEWLLDNCLRGLEAKSGSILLWNEAGGFLSVLQSKGIPAEYINSIKIYPGEGVAGWVAFHKTPLLIQNIETDPRFRSSERLNYENASLISVPLLYQNKLIGILNINNKTDGYAFTKNDLALAVTVSERLAMAVSSSRIFHDLNESAQENQRARRLMEKIIPSVIPTVPGLRLSVNYHPYKDIGGDFFNFFPMDDTHFGILLADVSGHGLSSALLSVMVNTMIQTFEKTVLKSPSSFLIQLNNSLAGKMGGYFLTAFYCVIDLEKGEISYAKGGHPSPVLYRDMKRKSMYLNSAGKIIGIIPNVLYEERKISFQKNDVLIVFTDGIVETVNDRTGKTYGADRLSELLNESGIPVFSELNQRIIEDAFGYTDTRQFSDDVTLITVKRE